MATRALLSESDVINAISYAAKKFCVELKDKQVEPLQHFCAGKDVFVSLSTGYGKSMIASCVQ